MSDWNELGRRLLANLPPEIRDPQPLLGGDKLVISATKPGTIVAVPREMALDAGLVEPTPAERTDSEQRAADARRREAERGAALETARGQLAAITDPLARRILDLHAEDERGECGGCDFSGWEAERPDWPCSTVENVAAHYGISLEAP